MFVVLRNSWLVHPEVLGGGSRTIGLMCFFPGLGVLTFCPVGYKTQILLSPFVSFFCVRSADALDCEQLCLIRVFICYCDQLCVLPVLQKLIHNSHLSLCQYILVF